MASTNITLEGIDQALNSLSYISRSSPKAKLIKLIRSYYKTTEDLSKIQNIPLEILVSHVWDIPKEEVSKINSRKKNALSVRNTINKDLQKLFESGLNPEGIIINENNTFSMSDNAREKLLSSFTESFSEGNEVSLSQISEVLNTIKEFLQKSREQNESEDKSQFETIQSLLSDIEKNFSESENEDQESESSEDDEKKSTTEVELGDDEELEIIEDDESEEDFEFEEVEEDGETEEVEPGEDEEFEEVDEDESGSEGEETEEVELGEDEELEEVDEDEAGYGDVDTEEVELGEDEELEVLDEDDSGYEDEETEEVELGEDEEFEEVDEDDSGYGDEETEEVELGEDEEFEEVDEDDSGYGDEDTEEVELDEDDETEEVELEDDEDIDPDDAIELDEDEELVDADEIEYGEEDEIEEKPPELGLPTESLGEFENYLDKHNIESRRLLSEKFDSYLGAMDRYYNQFLIIEEGKYKKGSPWPVPEIDKETITKINTFYMAAFPVTNALFEIFTEKTGYITTAEDKGFSTVFESRYKTVYDYKTGKHKSVLSSTGKSGIVKGASWHQPFGPGSDLHKKRSHPVVHISLKDALSFCAWIGKKLPSEYEWEAGARTKKGYPFPWGSQWKENACNTENSGKGDTSPVDEYETGINELGISETLGNVWEWTTERIEKHNKTFYIAKGGSFVSDQSVRLWSRFFLKPDFTANILGFRCIVD